MQTEVLMLMLIIPNKYKMIILMGSLMAKRIKEKTVYKNKNGKIVCIEDMMFGGTRYMLFNADENYVKDIQVPFRVADYL